MKTVLHALYLPGHSEIPEKSMEDRLADLHEKAFELEASMQYASRLQQALLPEEIQFKNVFSDAFIFYRPRDIVSGDFYWVFPFEDQVYFAVGDCTGHGVPGAMVSMAGMTLLRQVIRRKGLKDPARILTILDEEITSLFNDNVLDGVTRDGMDMAFARYDKSQQKIFYCGANRSLLHVRNGELTELDGDRFSLGYFDIYHKAFTTQEIAVEKNDLLYLFTDGYTDQFGGANIKKFNRKRFRTLLSSLSEFSMSRQKNEVEEAFREWKGKYDQIDDVCVMGLKL
ncbi:MAG: PP2C family protein-serine/threonine phosphatase [Flavobacteriales bacterium]